MLARGCCKRGANDAAEGERFNAVWMKDRRMWLIMSIFYVLRKAAAANPIRQLQSESRMDTDGEAGPAGEVGVTKGVRLVTSLQTTVVSESLTDAAGISSLGYLNRAIININVWKLALSL
ncbi:hypothetical protein IF1G_02461 [Cordyceps javanica]|uniref:Uncharacterized protein n=1 Tax=Cordyceps javanica TaxID=43265 RepID=A0A545V9H4_9HYPO|nr:hypothetical protein IF1G_02461 [Cordyceps javanica]TQW09597.1 hypothetical protein IF2G_02387 [Cordyceps javanica]